MWLDKVVKATQLSPPKLVVIGALFTVPVGFWLGTKLGSDDPGTITIDMTADQAVVKAAQATMPDRITQRKPEFTYRDYTYTRNNLFQQRQRLLEERAEVIEKLHQLEAKMASSDQPPPTPS
ncbi:hypothetical protein H4R34_001549 [Dimargaris verticillata]|uniref:Uncharacterized protein n=1 Tax=Dimargaris verticillata TaxID=2761393 RepID=A0A9W8EDP4_9FUNG|nr:hypothetical protein H4R34_001549 [Dimargaris verticillata]